MKKIAVLSCSKVAPRCTFAGCLKAFNTKTKAFEVYGEEDIQLEAAFRCNGCESGIDEGFMRKLDKVIEKEVDACHLGHCTARKELDGAECPTITRAAKYLESHGIKVVRGTH